MQRIFLSEGHQTKGEAAAVVVTLNQGKERKEAKEEREIIFLNSIKR